MKVLIVIDGLGAGGAEMSTALMCDYLHENRVSFEIVCLQKKQIGVQESMLAKGYKIYFINNLSYPRQILFIKNLIKKNQYDVVHSILLKSNLRVRFARMLTRFVHIESLVNETYSDYRLSDPRVNKFLLRQYLLLDKLTSGYVDHFHSITEAVKKHYVEKVNVKAEKISVIYRGRNPYVTNVQTFKRSDLGIGEADFLIVNTGRQEFQKGQLYLLKALDNLIRAGHKNIKLLFLGRNGNVTNELNQFIAENNLGDYVLFPGHRSDVMSVLSAADIFAFPSLYEGLGGALIEAQAAGLPIVCNDLAVLKEVVQEDKNAKLFSSLNIESIANAILFFINHPEKKAEFGKESLRNFENKFQLNDIHAKMLAMYERLSNNNTSVKK
jgi:glycosyltransferase involved in cell wall biosynthesis